MIYYVKDDSILQVAIQELQTSSKSQMLATKIDPSFISLVRNINILHIVKNNE